MAVKLLVNEFDVETEAAMSDRLRAGARAHGDADADCKRTGHEPTLLFRSKFTRYLLVSSLLGPDREDPRADAPDVCNVTNACVNEA